MFLPKLPLGLSVRASGGVALRIEPRRQMLIPFIRICELLASGGNVHNTCNGGLGEEKLFYFRSPGVVCERGVIDDCLEGYSKIHGRRVLLPQLGANAVCCQTVSRAPAIAFFSLWLRCQQRGVYRRIAWDCIRGRLCDRIYMLCTCLGWGGK